MSNYYVEHLGSQKLYQVYETALPRIKQYLQAEIDFVCDYLDPDHDVLELGAGYGRIIRELAPHCRTILGLDISDTSVAWGKACLNAQPNARLEVQDVHELALDRAFDIILCLQNGLSALSLTDGEIKKILRFLRPGGMAFFSTYSDKFWQHRLAWFEEQTNKGLLGKLDHEKTKDGVIVCKDGFQAFSFSEAALKKIGESTGLPFELAEVDASSLFLVIHNDK